MYRKRKGTGEVLRREDAFSCEMRKKWQKGIYNDQFVQVYFTITFGVMGTPETLKVFGGFFGIKKLVSRIRR
jgi:hypothetical protein